MGNALTSVLVLDGIIAGTWKRVLARARVELAVSPFQALRKTEKEAIRSAASAYGEFLGLPVSLSFAEALDVKYSQTEYHLAGSEGGGHM
jgi:hypothetical protein